MAAQKFLSHLDNAPALGYLLWRSARKWQQHVNGAVAPLQLTSTQATILLACERLTKPQKLVTPMDIVKHTGIGKVTASQAIRTLVAKGFLTVNSSTDKRAKTLQLTKEGGRRARHAADAIAQAHTDFFSEIPAATRDELSAILARFIVKGAEE